MSSLSCTLTSSAEFIFEHTYYDTYRLGKLFCWRPWCRRGTTFRRQRKRVKGGTRISRGIIYFTENIEILVPPERIFRGSKYYVTGPMCYFREIWASTGQTDARPSTGALTVSTLVSAFKVIFLYEFVSLSGTNISKYDNASVWQTCSYSLCDFTSSP